MNAAGDRAQRGDGWDATRRRVLDRDGNACRFCGITNDEHKEKHDTELHAHHIIPKRDGGDDVDGNLITVCCRCHRTLEETHGKAVAQIERKRSQETKKTKAVATYTVRYAWHKADEIDDALGEFYKDHPTFSRRFDLFDEGGSAVTIESRNLREMLGDVSSEWAFLINWGYREGMIHAAGKIEGWGGADILDDDALAESNLPEIKNDGEGSGADT